MRILIYIIGVLCGGLLPLHAQETPADRVNPFIGTTNYGTCNPGAMCPRGLMSVVPFNVMGDSPKNRVEKDRTWWSAPYEYRNEFLTGFSHVNMSGVGCPEMGALLLMPISGALETDYNRYGSEMSAQEAAPGYYAVTLDKYGIRCEATATLRTSRLRFTFPKGQNHVLLHLGAALSNEQGGSMRFASDNEVEGSRMLGSFCYNPQAVFPIYFVLRVHRKPQSHGYWKQMPDMGVEAQWDSTAGKQKIYRNYDRTISGDDLGAWLSFESDSAESVEVSMGVSFVSIENARKNLDTEQPQGTTFDQLRTQAKEAWNRMLECVEISGGTEEQRTVFYTALYHTLIHPNILQDSNGEYPAMETGQTKSTKKNRYTVFSLWDTYRNMHQLQTLLYPKDQCEMMETMVEMYKEYGWLPKWELYGRETHTMEGDPAIPVLVDSWLKGLRTINIEEAYAAMRKSAVTMHNNPLRPDNEDYLKLGYVPLRSKYDNSVSHALEYYVADHALSLLAKALGKKDDAHRFRKQAQGYRHYYSKETGTLRPLLPDGSFYKPFNPRTGENFEPVPGFHEGSAWNYTFFVPHDVQGLEKLMGRDSLIARLQRVFDENLYDPTNEPDIAYPYLFSYYPSEAWHTQKLTQELLARHFTNRPGGLPGNDDTGTMSAWAVFSMMGFYPHCPGVPEYTFTTPIFDQIRLKLDEAFYPNKELVIRKIGKGAFIRRILLDGKPLKGYIISHERLRNTHTVVMEMSETHD